MPISYDKNVDYKALMDSAIAAGDYKSAAQYEQQRNAKIAGEGITDYQQTHDLGSIYDAQNMTNSELRDAYNSRLSYQSGQTDIGSSHGYVENIRKNYGYSGGSDGSQYIPLEQQKKQSFSYQAAPSYVNKYQDLIDELSGKILNRDPFSYDAESDPLYQQYKTSYTRGGERAMQNTLGQMAARTGGLASSYAGSAAQQTYDGYMSALADKIPELQQLAYEMYQDEGEKQRLNLEMISALEREDYGKYQDLLGQYNTDRSFAYGQFRDELSDQRYADDTAYNRGIYDNETAYDRNLQRAKTLAGMGDFSGYKALGYSDEEIQRLQAAYLLEHPEMASLYQTGGTAGGYTDPNLAVYWMSGAASPLTGWMNGTSGWSGSAAGGSGKSSAGSGSAAGGHKTGSTEQIKAAATDTSQKTSSVPYNGVTDLGIGPRSDSYVDQLIREGKVEAYTGMDGRLYVKWRTGFNNANYGG